MKKIELAKVVAQGLFNNQTPSEVQIQEALGHKLKKELLEQAVLAVRAICQARGKSGSMLTGGIGAPCYFVVDLTKGEELFIFNFSDPDGALLAKTAKEFTDNSGSFQFKLAGE